MNAYKSAARGTLLFRDYVHKVLHLPGRTGSVKKKPRRINEYRALRRCALGHK